METPRKLANMSYLSGFPTNQKSIDQRLKKGVIFNRKGGDNVYYTSHQSFLNVFLFVGLTTSWTLVNFDWFVY